MNNYRKEEIVNDIKELGASLAFAFGILFISFLLCLVLGVV